MRLPSATARSGPYGSGRLGTALTSFTSALARLAMQYRSQGGGIPPSKLARHLLQTGLTWVRIGHRPGVQGTCRRSVEEGPNGESNTDDQQQELFVLVAARLA